MITKQKSMPVNSSMADAYFLSVFDKDSDIDWKIIL